MDENFQIAADFRRPLLFSSNETLKLKINQLLDNMSSQVSKIIIN